MKVWRKHHIGTWEMQSLLRYTKAYKKTSGKGTSCKYVLSYFSYIDSLIFTSCRQRSIHIRESHWCKTRKCSSPYFVNYEPYRSQNVTKLYVYTSLHATQQSSGREAFVSKLTELRVRWRLHLHRDRKKLNSPENCYYPVSNFIEIQVV